jgi:hypothetical protein
MGAPSRPIRVGGLIAACLWLGAGQGSAQTGVGAPAANSTGPASTTTQPAATPARLSVADAAALKADPNCQPAAVACAWSQCYPLSSKWTSYSKCLEGSCQMTERTCVMDLLDDLYDPVRERSRGAR